MIKIRNTLVVLDLIEKAESKISNIVIPTGNDMYSEAEVVAVGPGTSLSGGSTPETFDLKVGQRVLVKHKQRNRPEPYPADLCGIRYQDGSKFYYIFEQSSIIGILAEPGTFPPQEYPKLATGNQIDGVVYDPKKFA